MGEFVLPHLVAELVNLFGGKIPPDKLLDAIQKSVVREGFNETSAALESQVQQITATLDNPELFLSMLEDLKQKKVDSLPQFVELLSLISNNPKIKNFLHKTAKQEKYPPAGVNISNSTDITKEDLPQMRWRLKKATTKSSKAIKSDPNSSVISSHGSSLPLATTPSLVSWVQRKPTMSWDFSTSGSCLNSATVPVFSQEHILLDDLLNVLIGVPGRYIEPEELKDPYGSRTFKINDNVPFSLRELVNQILPLASHYSSIQRFIEEKMQFEFGQVNNALAEKMDLILKDHMLFVIQLESEFRSQNLSLQKLWFLIQKNLSQMGIAANIVSSISKADARGGKVLSLLHDYIINSTGDDKIYNLCVQLMEAACVPYMQMLSMWIYRGIISDPISEFLIEDNELVGKEEMPLDYSSDYWDKKYAIRRERVPKFLEPVVDKILKTGKYLNVIRQCGKPNKTKILPIHYKSEEKHYTDAIEKAYTFASQTLLDLVLKEEDLIGRLKTVKHYFLLEKGDFIGTFLGLTEKEMNKHISDVNQGRLESLMDLALRLSSAVNDPYKDDLNTELLHYGLQTQMTRILRIQPLPDQETKITQDQKNLLVVESFAFSYNVQWPLSLILNKKSMACYQMIFRHLFYCKHVDRMICQVWRSNKVAKKFQFDDAQHYRMAFCLRQKMLHCVQNLEYHMMLEVIEPHWCIFMQRISKVNNVDEILVCHSDFLDKCLRDCMLTIPHVLATIVKILAICVEFCRFMQSESVIQVPFNSENGDSTPSFKDKITEFDTEFTSSLVTLLDQINELNKDTKEHERLFNLLYRIDFNLLYSNRLGKYENLIRQASG